MICPDVKKLYKYKSFISKDDNEEEYNRYTIDSILNGNVWFADPSDFNDPFDCNCDFLKRDIDRVASDEGEKQLWDVLENHIEWRYGQIIKCLGIFSLSEACDNILMWSHYANFHNGLCFEYSRDSSSLLGDDMYTKPVRYSNHYPKFAYEEVEHFIGNNKFTIQDPIFQALVYTKYSDWHYEKEWRVIQPVTQDRNISLGEITLSAVIFGLNTSDKIKKYVVDAINKTNNKITVRQTRKRANEFALQVVDL